MQAVALALVACMALYCYTRAGECVSFDVRKLMRRVLWLVLAIYLLSPIVAGAFGVLVMLMV